MLLRMITSTSMLGLLLLESEAYAATCGNGVFESGETCEDGNTINGDGCDDTCTIESGWDCTEAVFELDFFENYSEDGHGAPNWVLSSSGRTVTQSINSKPSIYVSTLPATGVEATFTLEVDTSSDDDFIGWAVGYEQGDFYSSTAEWILFDWKQSDQANSGCSPNANGGGAAGLAMSRVTGAINGSDPWCHTNAIQEISRATNLGYSGWNDYTEYTITMI